MSGFAHPEYLVTTEWLAAHLDDPNVIVLDCAMHLGPPCVRTPFSIFGVVICPARPSAPGGTLGSGTRGPRAGSAGSRGQQL